jgi:hypothetical protein
MKVFKQDVLRRFVPFYERRMQGLHFCVCVCQRICFLNIFHLAIIFLMLCNRGVFGWSFVKQLRWKIVQLIEHDSYPIVSLE